MTFRFIPPKNMHQCRHSARHEKVVIQKAKKNKPKSFPTLSSRMSSAVKVSFIHGIRTFKENISERELTRAVKTGSVREIMRTIPWTDLGESLGDTFAHLGTAYFKAGGDTIKKLPGPVKENLRWDASNPAVGQYLTQRRDRAIVDISMSTRDYVQKKVIEAFEQAKSPKAVAAEIKGSIGLFPAWQGAVDKYRNELIDKDYAPERVAEMASQYENELLTSRSEMIARTEIRMATNNGQNEVWQEGARLGLIDRRTTTRVWVVDGGPCDICSDMDGVEVGIDEPWCLQTGLNVIFLPILILGVYALWN